MARHRPRRKTRFEAAMSALRIAAFVVVGGGLLGFAVFSGRIMTYRAPEAPAADAVIALTGGEGRVAAGAVLLQAGAGDRLLISGVHPAVTEADLRAAAGGDAGLFTCCVDLGREAADTIGNAMETARWARERGYRRLIVVTSDYHMPRSLLELRSTMPEAELIAYPVRTPRPWSDTRWARRWTLEYMKYVAVLTRVTLSGPRSEAEGTG